MNINALTNLLLDLTYQSSNKISPATRADGVARIRDANADGDKAMDAGNKAGQQARVETGQTEEQAAHPLAFIPLPLRSDYFPEARFFAKQGGKKAGTADPEEQVSEIFICLITENLGRVWIDLSCRNDEFLSVKYFTDNEPTSKILKEHFPLIRNDLKTIGFEEIALTSRARAELGAVVEGLLPRFEEHLLDQKI